MAVSTTSIVSDIVTDVRDHLQTNLTDPRSSRTVTQWVLTGYPNVRVQYPVVIVQQVAGRDRWGGIGTENKIVTVTLNIEVWTDSTKERNTVWDDVYDELRTHFTTADGGGNSITGYGMHHMRLISAVNVDTPYGESQIHRKIGTVEFTYYASN